jgi:hypothetical protein
MAGVASCAPITADAQKNAGDAGPVTEGKAHPVKRRIRGQEHALAMAPRVTLLDALRERRRRRGQSGVIFGRIDIAFGLRAREK